jgi:hypothetical protein
LSQIRSGLLQDVSFPGQSTTGAWVCQFVFDYFYLTGLGTRRSKHARNGYPEVVRWNHVMERYFTELANAFVRGKLSRADGTIEDGINAGLRLHKFKVNSELPRVQRVLGILRGVAPENLLDIGSGRGTFLWPLLSAFPELRVTAVDSSQWRSRDLAAVRRGGIERLERWASHHVVALREILGRRDVMYGEWLYARHTIGYDRLPHYFLEFDILDRESGAFLSTEARRSILAGGPVRSVPVLGVGPVSAIDNYLGESRCSSTEMMEGLYLKREDESVTERYKYVRSDFLQAVANSDSHWMDRPIEPNRLAEGIDLSDQSDGTMRSSVLAGPGGRIGSRVSRQD